MFSEKDLLVKREQYRDLVHQLERESLVRQVLAGDRVGDRGFRRIWPWSRQLLRTVLDRGRRWTQRRPGKATSL